ncbi:MAG TPA: septal ring lytic transglycosylase RlpA family protein [Casimicrobiaceae bacterium]|nr:septal ring lytic transglycosylase RlpA family protein [Casimicrobiaceae bacterium]
MSRRWAITARPHRALPGFALRSHFRLVALLALALVAGGCPKEETSTPRTEVYERGPISLYGKEFAGRKTASGAIFDPEALTMAHRSLPFGTRVRVVNLENQRTVEVVVNDRGPAIKSRIADLSLAAARRIGMIEDGVVEAELSLVPSETRH